MVINWLFLIIIRVGDMFYFYDLVIKICKNFGVKVDYKFLLFLVLFFLWGVRLILDVDVLVEEGVKIIEMGWIFFL